MSETFRLRNSNGQYLQIFPDGAVRGVSNPGRGATFERTPWNLAWAVDPDPEPPAASAPPSTPTGPRIKGRLRVDMSTPRPSWRDDTGPIHPLFCTCFPLMRLAKFDRPRFEVTMGELAAHFMGTRFLAAVGYWSKWGFDGRGWLSREVAPVSFTNESGSRISEWLDYEDILRQVLDAHRVRGLKAFLSNGDLQAIFTGGVGETAHHERLAHITKDYPDVVEFYETANERWQNAYLGGDVDRARMFAQAFETINPWPHVLLSAPPGDAEEAANMIAWSTSADACTIHGTRHTWVDAIRRCFNVEYETRRHGQLKQAMIQGEPTGPGRDVYQPTNDPDQLFGIYAMHKMCGHMSVYLNSAGIRMKEGSIAQGWGFTELGPLLAHIPDDIGTWPHLRPGHRGDAPIYATQFEDQGEGPHRVDCVHDGKRVVAMVYGGRGQWDIRSRWTLRYRVLASLGISAGSAAVVDPGGRVSSVHRADQQVRIIIGEKV